MELDFHLMRVDAKAISSQLREKYAWRNFLRFGFSRFELTGLCELWEVFITVVPPLPTVC